MTDNKSETGADPQSKEQKQQHSADEHIEVREESQDHVYEAAAACESTPFFTSPSKRRGK